MEHNMQNIDLLMIKQHQADLLRLSNYNRIKKAYPDAERKPRILRYWANAHK